MATIKDTTLVNDDDAAALQSWLALMDSGRIHMDRRALELSLHDYTSALHLCESHPSTLAERKYLVLGGLGWLHRLNGRYSDAVRILEEALALADSVPVSGPPTRERVQIAGELGTVYRLMDRHEDARRAFAENYALAKELDLRAATCRAVGNLGMANYQRALEMWNNVREVHDDNERDKRKQKINEIREILDVAMQQLQERAARAFEIYEKEKGNSSHGPSVRSGQATGWRAIAFCRLSLCHTLLASLDREETDTPTPATTSTSNSATTTTETPEQRYNSHLEQAVSLTKTALASLHLRERATPALPLAHFFHGRALLNQGHRDQALAHLDPENPSRYSDGRVTTPAMVLCKEHSAEHLEYLRELVAVGVDLLKTDGQGYTALDHAVFSGNLEGERIILEALLSSPSSPPRDGEAHSGGFKFSEEEVRAMRQEAYLRKGYRLILQERIRPVLFSALSNPDSDDTGEGGERQQQQRSKTTPINKIRRVYAGAIAEDPEKEKVFDQLRYV